MALKSCVYRDCENYVNVVDKTYSKENLTFFQFPKNPERRKKWIELGKAPPNLPANYYYYCSDHFDKRYLCVGNRRTILVGESLPYPYENGQDQFVAADGEEELYYIRDDAPVEDQDLQVESTTMQDCDIIQYLNIDEYESSEVFNEKTVNETNNDLNNLKRRREECVKFSPPVTSNNQLKIMKCASLSERPLSKAVSLVKAVSIKTDSVAPVAVNIVKTNRLEKVVSESTKDSCSSRQDNSPESTSLIDVNNVTTFIFKGEEYVQMPKEHYIKEKIDMIKKLQKMEMVIGTIKEQLLGL